MAHSDFCQAGMPREVTRIARFFGFAGSHFLISFAGLAIGFPVLEERPSSALIGIEVVLLALYVAAGFWLARRKRWSVPHGFREGLWAFLPSALVAWAWGALVVISLWAGSIPLLIAEYFGTMVFAFPSFAMVYLMLGFGSNLIFNLVVCLAVCALFAGGIPPLLFFLGSLWGSKKAQAAGQ